MVRRTSQSSSNAENKFTPDEQLDDEGEEEVLPDFTEEKFDVSNEVLCPELMLERPREYEGLSNIIIVDNIPKVDQSKLEKLKGALAKVFSIYGKYRNEYYPMNEQGITKGYAFFEYDNEQSAQDAVKLANGHRLDTRHTFAVNLMSDFDKLSQIPPEPTDTGNLQEWLLESDAADQFAVQSEDRKTTIYANALSQPIVVTERVNWTESHFVWSSKGTYFASFHEQGIVLWGGKDFKRVQRFTHPGVTYIDFSPNERYLITVSANPSNTDAFIVWDTITGVKKRGFPLDQHSSSGSGYFKWSCQDQFFARQGAEGIFIYDTESFQLVDKKPFRIASLGDFQWSPTDNRLAYWTAGDGNVPARLVLVELNANKLDEVRSKTVFNVIDCKLCWQTRGDYLLVRVDRYAKKSGEKNNPKYSGLLYNFEIFHAREKDVPLDTLEVKETIQSFAVEPNGNKLVVITGEGIRTNVTFYRLGQGQKSGKVEALKTLSLPVTTAVWAPTGQYVVLAAIKAGAVPGGLMIFIDANELTTMGKQEHPGLSDVEWDPTGRFLTSYASVHTSKHDHSFKIWKFQGTIVYEKPTDRLVSFHWRPRPVSLLTDEMIKEVRRNRNVWTRHYESYDQKYRTRESEEQREQRRKVLGAFRIIREKNQRRLAIQKHQRFLLRGGKDLSESSEQQTNDVEEESVQFLINDEKVEWKP